MIVVGLPACGGPPRAAVAGAVSDAATGSDFVADADRDAAAAMSADAAPDADVPDAGSPWIPATVGRSFATFRLTSSGEGTDRLRALALADDVGSFALADTRYRGVAYRVSESFASYDVFAVLAIADDGSDLALLYLYCMGDELAYAFSESLTLPLASEQATGRCDYIPTPIFMPDVSLPPLFKSLVAVDTGTSIDGPDLALSALGGRITLLDKSWDVLPFGSVDCSSCPGGPWYEVHTMLHRASVGCFAILYLFPDRPDQVDVANVLCLPSLEQPYATFDAAWTRTASTKLSW